MQQSDFTFLPGGVTAARGFSAAGIHCGIRKNKQKRDLALIKADAPCAAAAVYTQNLVQGAPIAVTRRHLADGRAQAVIVNSGNANTCNADGEEKAEAMCVLAAAQLGIAPEDVIVASTGVIGQPLDIAPIRDGLPQLCGALSAQGSSDAAEAIMTTDTVRKEAAVEFTLGGVQCRLGGICKGSGMIHPNMATMLGFLTTDAAISPEMLHRALSESIQDTFNMVSVDGDTSTNDMVCVLASGAAGNARIEAAGPDYETFRDALLAVNTRLCKMMAKDGEGATKLVVCRVSGAQDAATAKICAKSVITSSLVKAAMFGADANWGRVLCALGYAGADIDVNAVDVDFVSQAGRIAVCRGGAGVAFDEGIAKQVLTQDEILVDVTVGQGPASAEAFGCDLTYDYVKINGDYRT